MCLRGIAVDIGSWLLGGIGAGGLLGAVVTPGDTPLTPAQEKARDYESYKKICNQPTPPGLDKCEAAKWSKNKLQQCYSARDQYTKNGLVGIMIPGMLNKCRNYWVR